MKVIPIYGLMNDGKNEIFIKYKTYRLGPNIRNAIVIKIDDTIFLSI